MKSFSLVSSAAVLGAVILSSSPVLAEDSFKGLNLPGDFAANVALTTDYVFRGISQSNEEPTIQGGIDWTEPTSGAYLGIWGSGVDFTDASAEFDFYGGFAGSMDAFSWKLGGIYYYYPGADDSLNYDFWELAAVAGYDFDILQASFSLNYSPDYFASSGDSYYASLDATAPLPHDFSLTGHVAHQWISDNAAFGTEDYTDWAVGVGYTIEGFNLSLKYIDTDLSEPDECADGCGDRVVFTLSKSF